MLRIERWTASQIADAVHGSLRGSSDERVTGVSTDTRSLSPGQCFVALRGPRFDAHAFVDQAVAQGATLIIASQPVEAEGVSLIEVEDTLDALQALGAAIFEEARAEGVHAVALTGSNGKTTTKELLAAIWSTRGRVHATRGNLNNHIGVPLTLCAMPQDCEHVIVEMGANGFGDIAELIAMAPADERIITSIGLAHIEGFGSLDGVRAAKSEIFERSRPQDLAIVPAAEAARLSLAGFRGEVLTVGRDDEQADVVVDVRRRKAGVSHVAVRRGDFEGTFELPLPGPHNAFNLGIAVATMLGRGLCPDVDAINALLSELHLPGGRLRHVEAGSFHFVDDAYNANPTSMIASFDAFVEWAQGEQARREQAWGAESRVAVLGEMLELGVEAERLHAETARNVATRGGVAALLMVGAYAEAMAEAAREVTEAEVCACPTVEDAVRWLARRGRGIVFLKASRGQRLERIIELVSE